MARMLASGAPSAKNASFFHDGRGRGDRHAEKIRGLLPDRLEWREEGMIGQLLMQHEGVSRDDHGDAGEQPQMRRPQLTRRREDHGDSQAQAPERDRQIVGRAERKRCARGDEEQDESRGQAPRPANPGPAHIGRPKAHRSGKALLALEETIDRIDLHINVEAAVPALRPKGVE